MRQPIKYLVSSVLASLFVVFTLAPSAMALTWATVGPNLKNPAGYTSFIFNALDGVYDSSGNLNVVADKLNATGDTWLALSHGVFNGTSWTFTDIETTSVANGFEAEIDIDSAGVVGIAYSDDQGDNSKIIYYRNSGDSWADKDTVLTTAADPSIDLNAFDLAFDGNDDPVIVSADFQGGNYGIFSFIKTGVDFASVGSSPYSHAVDYVRSVSLDINASNTGSLIYSVIPTGNRVNVWRAAWTGSDWNADASAISGLTNVSQVGSNTDLLAMALDSSGNPSVAVWSDTSTAAGDVLNVASFAGANWTTSPVISNIDAGGGTLRNALQIVGTNKYLSFVLEGATFDTIRFASNEGSGWSSELIVQLSGPGVAFGNGWLAYDATSGDFVTMTIDGGTFDLFLYGATTALPAAVPEFSTYIYLATLMIAIAGINVANKRSELGSVA